MTTKKAKPVEVEEVAPTIGIGQTVHYIGNDAVHRDAIVTHVFGGEIVNLFVLPDNLNSVVRHVGRNDYMIPNTWHFIEQANG
jgi:hypothetical protein